MTDEIDQLQSELQEMVLAEARKLYTETVIDHAINPRHVGEISDADGYGNSLGSCGDDIEIWFKVIGDRITKANFWTDGCSTSIASGSMATELITNQTIAKAHTISQGDILDALGGLPEESQHCAQLAANAVKEAVKNYLAYQREPWKRAYRKG